MPSRTGNFSAAAGRNISPSSSVPSGMATLTSRSTITSYFRSEVDHSVVNIGVSFLGRRSFINPISPRGRQCLGGVRRADRSAALQKLGRGNNSSHYDADGIGDDAGVDQTESRYDEHG